jgi:hypothetical protein
LTTDELLRIHLYSWAWNFVVLWKRVFWWVLKFVDFQFLAKNKINNLMQSNLTLNCRTFYLQHIHIFMYHTALVNKFNPCLWAIITQKSAEKRWCMFVIYRIETWQEVFVGIKFSRILNLWIDLPTKTTKFSAPRIIMILQYIWNWARNQTNNFFEQFPGCLDKYSSL